MVVDQETLETWTDELALFYNSQVGPFFKRIEAQERGLAYVKGLLSETKRKNGWQLAETSGDQTPDGMQRVLTGSQWDVDGVRDAIRTWVKDTYGHRDGVLIIDETGFIKKGNQSAGVQRQYSGTAGRIENSQVGVFLAYSFEADYTLIDRELYLPKDWASDQDRRQAAYIPETVSFATKGELAMQMVKRTLAAKMPFQWVSADSVYGDDGKIRQLLESEQRYYVLAVARTHKTWYGIEQQTVEALAATAPPTDWQRLSGGTGAKGERLYEWLLLPLPRETPVVNTFAALLVRRHIVDAELTYYLTFAPIGTPLQTLVQIAGSRWKIEECFELAKQEVGLADYEVRRYDAWYRHITLALLALAFLSIVRHHLALEERPKKRPGRPAHVRTAYRARAKAAHRSPLLGRSPTPGCRLALVVLA